jgi:hypothetical protein
LFARLDAADRDVKSQRAREKSSSVVEIPDKVPKADCRVAERACIEQRAMAEGAANQVSKNACPADEATETGRTAHVMCNSEKRILHREWKSVLLYNLNTWNDTGQGYGKAIIRVPGECE